MVQQVEDYDEKIKIVLAGESSVGKTSILNMFTEKFFRPTFISTIGIDFKVVFREARGKRLKVQIWDTAGQERFRTITNSYIKGADGIILVFDVTSHESLELIKNWMQNVHKRLDEGSNAEFVLVGNKCDIGFEGETKEVVNPQEGGEEEAVEETKESENGEGPKRVVTEQEGKDKAQEFEMPYYECSAKTGQNVNEAFMSVIERIVEDRENNKNKKGDKEVINLGSKEKGKSCC